MSVLCFVREGQSKMLVEPWDLMTTVRVKTEEEPMKSGLNIEDDKDDKDVECKFK